VSYESGVPVETAPHDPLDAALCRVVELEAALTTTTEALSKTSAALETVTTERDKLRHAYEHLKGQFELLRGRAHVDSASAFAFFEKYGIPPLDDEAVERIEGEWRGEAPKKRRRRAA
jgi:hypothetical protein